MNPNRPRCRGALVLFSEHLLLIALGAILAALAILGIILAALKVASAPQITKLLAVLGLGTVIYILTVEDKTKIETVHEQIRPAYSVVLIAYVLHWLEDYVHRAEALVQRWREKLADILNTRTNGN